MSKLTPKSQMRHVFFENLGPGPFPLRVSAEQSVQETWNGEPLARLRHLHEPGRSGEIDMCRNYPDHLA